MTTASTSMLPLHDGRRLAYLRMGRAGGRPVLFCHGTPGSRLFRPPESIPESLGVDLVTADRPGYGGSGPQPHRRLLDWPNDAVALADRLGWTRFAVAGVSGGGPHALACAVRYPDRVAAVGLVSSVAPFWPDALDGMLATTRRGFEWAHRSPALLRFGALLAARRPDRFVRGLGSELPDCDRRILARPEIARMAAENARAALTGDAMAREMVLLRRDWEFRPSDVVVPVELWHGELDRNVPVAHGRRLAAALPNCRATFVPDAGHYLIHDIWADVLAAVSRHLDAPGSRDPLWR
ncbi:alpha/beta fold hydrolase [Nocardia sp. ET3-3]|uniref:Alpha/beta fold hydrolase n=1 Tax=Nocardia terrae TaxID=2675851 RepID=A0A7K1UVC0_9NOCA|nr:alpha/beta hydrolase [Nocardia terrae]MVU78326.1 alpha/beta fold hydrolase [Nocardia terrae]